MDIRDCAFDLGQSCGSWWVGAKHTVTRIRQALEEAGAVSWVKACIQCNDRTQVICLKLPVLGIIARSDRGADLLCRRDRRFVAAINRGDTAQDYRTSRRRARLAVKMVEDVMAGLVSDDEGDLIGVAGRCDQRQGKADDWAAIVVYGLESVRLQSRTIIDDELEIAIDRLCPALQAFPLDRRFHAAHHADKGPCGRIRGSDRRRCRLWLNHSRARRRGLPFWRQRSTGGQDREPRQNCRSKFCFAQTSAHPCVFLVPPGAIDPPLDRHFIPVLRSCKPRPLPTQPFHAIVGRIKEAQMFTIEHDFDATVITLIDETGPNTRPLNEDVVILTFDDRVIVEQMNADGEEVARVTFTMHQLAELRLALNLPEGNYRIEKDS